MAAASAPGSSGGMPSAVLLVLEQLGRAAAVDGDHRLAAGHALDDHAAEGLGAGAGVDHHVEAADRRRGVGLEAGEADAVAQTQARGAAFSSSIVHCEPPVL